jgi:putative sterol carrier protein
MGDATTEFFDDLAQHAHRPMLEKVKGTMRFDLRDGDRTDRWLVTIDKGDLAVTRRNAKADCVLRAERQLFDGLASGEVNGMAALLRGAIVVEGDPQLIVQFQRLFPGPQSSQGQRATAPKPASRT